MPLPREIYKQGAVFAVSILGILLLIIVFSAPIMGMFALGPIVYRRKFYSVHSEKKYKETFILEALK